MSTSNLLRYVMLTGFLLYNTSLPNNNFSHKICQTIK